MRPESEAELTDCVAGLTSSVRIEGGGTRGAVTHGSKLSTAGLSGVTLYEPGALTLVAQAGTPLTEIKAALDAEGQRLAFEPMDHRGLLGTRGEPTIGGVVAANVSGPRRVQAGACRDFLLGVRFVDGSGHIIKNGGRVMKNVTGYDLVKLMAGSWGTLGVLTEVALKVLPKSETQATLAVQVPDAKAAVSVLSAALTSPFEVSGAAYDPVAGHALVRVEGFADSVVYRTDRLIELLKGFGEVEQVKDSAGVWASIRDVGPLQGKEGDVWRVSVKPGDAPEIAARMEADQVLFDWGGGLIWAVLPKGTNVRKRLGVFDGHATIIRADDETCGALGRFHPEAAPVSALTKAIRQKFDPHGRFNPGFMG